MEHTLKSPGRPAGREYPVVKQVRLATRDAEDLARLAGEWRCSEAAAIRRAIHEKAEETVRARRLRRRVTPEELRRAAEAAREYYSTDPEALEWADFVGDQPSYDPK